MDMPKRKKNKKTKKKLLWEKSPPYVAVNVISRDCTRKRIKYRRIQEMTRAVSDTPIIFMSSFCRVSFSKTIAPIIFVTGHVNEIVKNNPKKPLMIEAKMSNV